MHIEDIPYQAEGRTMVGHLAFDDQFPGRRPAVLVSHEGSGLDQHAKGIAERLAALGYIAFALDYFGDGKCPAFEQAQERMGALVSDPDQTARLARAGLDVLLAQDAADPGRAAAIGYCFGGVVSLELARLAPTSRPSSASTPASPRPGPPIRRTSAPAS